MLANERSRCESIPSKSRLSVSAWGTALVCLAGLTAGDARAFYVDDPWVVTASGTPTTLTWGFADDGTVIPANGSSDLISFFDGVFGVIPANGDLTQRPWFSLFQESFDRWSQLSGINFVYEAADDGATLQTSPGALGVRADIRIAGKYLDGPSGALASAWMPDTGDIVLDTGDAAYFSLALVNSVRPRNTLTHEIGHAMGLMHVASSDAALLMEPATAISFCGPQLDDIRGIQSLYGDAYEKTNSGLGNGTAARATSLGSPAMGGALSVGSDADGDQVVVTAETDFVSITNNADVDYYSFTVSTPGVLNVSLTPWGGIFSQGVPGGTQSLLDASRENNLSLAVLGPNGSSVLGSASSAAPGAVEVITDLQLASAGQYFVRVLGASNAVQLYELGLSLTQAGGSLAGDFNSDGSVNGTDFVVWQRSFGSTGTGLAADGNGDGRVDSADLAAWRSQYGQVAGLVAAVGVPEPGSTTLLSMLLVSLLGTLRQQTI